jgi:hypothetical protein
MDGIASLEDGEWTTALGRFCAALQQGDRRRDQEVVSLALRTAVLAAPLRREHLFALRDLLAGSHEILPYPYLRQYVNKIYYHERPEHAQNTACLTEEEYELTLPQLSTAEKCEFALIAQGLDERVIWEGWLRNIDVRMMPRGALQTIRRFLLGLDRSLFSDRSSAIREYWPGVDLDSPNEIGLVRARRHTQQLIRSLKFGDISKEFEWRPLRQAALFCGSDYFCGVALAILSKDTNDFIKQNIVEFFQNQQISRVPPASSNWTFAVRQLHREGRLFDLTERVTSEHPRLGTLRMALSNWIEFFFVSGTKNCN